MHPHHTLATGKWFFTHGFETMIILGFFVSIIAFLIGQVLWRSSGRQLRDLKRLNNSLRAQQTKLQKANRKLTEHLSHLS